jgi:hypothetical protein
MPPPRIFLQNTGYVFKYMWYHKPEDHNLHCHDNLKYHAITASLLAVLVSSFSGLGEIKLKKLFYAYITVMSVLHKRDFRM